MVKEPEVYGFSAWDRYSFWGAGVERMIGYEEDIVGGYQHLVTNDRLRAGVDAFGTDPTASLKAGAAAMPRGTVVWSGSLIGTDLGSSRFPPVFGQAEVRVDPSTLKGVVRLKNLATPTDRASRAARRAHLEYEIVVSGNSFSRSQGPRHRQVFRPGA